VLAAVGAGSVTAAAAPQTQAPAATPPPAPPLVRPAPTAVEAKSIPLTNMRKTIARRLVESKTTIPHFTVTVAVDMAPLLRVRQDVNVHLEAQNVRLSINDFVVRACAIALHRHPVCNSSWEQDVIRQPGTINIGVAVAISEQKGGGLVVPTLRDAQSMSLRQINAQTKALVAKARDTGLSIEEMSDGTFTLSNLGMLGVDHFEAIINPPQSAILAVGAAMEKPVVRDGRIVVGHEMTCTLSCDHRVIDGVEAAEFLQTLKSLLEHPAGMLV
jgi:pyruvate dehydrogenase E2 component (dihydrolipoamide acetyltransferase)